MNKCKEFFLSFSGFRVIPGYPRNLLKPFTELRFRTGNCVGESTIKHYSHLFPEFNVNKFCDNLKTCYKTSVFAHDSCFYPKSPYLCNVFFIVLDLRLTKVGVRRDSFFIFYPFLFKNSVGSSPKYSL